MTRSWWGSVALLVAVAFALNGCSSNNSGPTPTPIITSISPQEITAGSADFTLFVSGTGFIDTSVGTWNGSPRDTKLNTETNQLEISITAADVANPSPSNQVTILNPGLGGESIAVAFIVNPVANGSPTITPNSFSPPSAHAGTAGPFAVTLSGTNFVPTSVVTWNGSPRATTFVSATQLTVNFTTQDLATAGFGSVAVQNPAPGGGVSPSVDFPVN